MVSCHAAKGKNLFRVYLGQEKVRLVSRCMCHALRPLTGADATSVWTRMDLSWDAIATRIRRERGFSSPCEANIGGNLFDLSGAISRRNLGDIARRFERSQRCMSGIAQLPHIRVPAAQPHRAAFQGTDAEIHVE